jgi:hypothetical protein
MGRFSDLKIINEPYPRSEESHSESEFRRKKGKREHPDYTQISVYIRKAPYHEIKRMLVGSNQDFSDLVNELVEGWLTQRRDL